MTREITFFSPFSRVPIDLNIKPGSVPLLSLPTVVLAGCGYGAIAAMRALAGMARVIAINPYPYSVNSGMSTRLLSGRFSPELVKIPLLDPIARYQTEFLQGRVIQLIPGENAIRVQADQEVLTLNYDVLLLNVGQQVATHNVTGLSHAFSVRPMEQLVAARQHIQQCWIKAKTGDQTPGLLTFVVVGGGCTGVELMGELTDLCRSLSRETGIPFSQARLSLITSNHHLVPGISQRFSHLVTQSLQQQGIELWFQTKVNAIQPNSVMLQPKQSDPSHQSDPLTLPCLTTIWAGGLEVPGWLAESGLRTEPDGSILVDDTLRAVGASNILAMGDCASFPSGSQSALPKLGVYSVRSAPVVAKNLVHLLKHEPLQSYHPQSTVFISVTVGNRIAVMQKGKFVWRGYLATVLKNLFDWLYMQRLKPVRWQDFFY